MIFPIDGSKKYDIVYMRIQKGKERKMNLINVLKKLGTQLLNSKEKEVSEMKNIMIYIMALAMILGIMGPAYAATVVGSDTVAATATIAVVETMSAVTKTVSGNTNTSPAKTIAFGALAGGVTYAPAYIQVAYTCNDSLWAVCIYTNNTGASSATGSLVKYQRAGLLKSDGTDRIPLYWCVFNGVATPPTLALTSGAPTARTPAMYPVADPVANAANNKVTDWAVMKDKTDTDDPAMLALTPAVHTSWASAFGNVSPNFGGYCDIMYGTPSYANLSPFPYYDVAPETTGSWLPTNNAYPPTTNTIHRPATSTVNVYLAAFGGGASQGSYGSALSAVGLDLYHQ